MYKHSRICWYTALVADLVSMFVIHLNIERKKKTTGRKLLHSLSHQGNSTTMWKSEFIVVVIALAQRILIHPSGNGYYEEVRRGSFHICGTIIQCTKITVKQHNFSGASKRFYNISSLLYVFALILLNANDYHPNFRSRPPNSLVKFVEKLSSGQK